VRNRRETMLTTIIALAAFGLGAALRPFLEAAYLASPFAEKLRAKRLLAERRGILAAYCAERGVELDAATMDRLTADLRR
jgi:hypothetical protein